MCFWETIRTPVVSFAGEGDGRRSIERNEKAVIARRPLSIDTFFFDVSPENFMQTPYSFQKVLAVYFCWTNSHESSLA